MMPENLDRGTLAEGRWPVAEHATSVGFDIRVGTDLQPITEVKAALKRHGKRYLHRLFTQGEVCAAGGRDAGPEVLAPGLATLFAAKEATLKVLRPTRDLVPLWTVVHVQIRRGVGVGHRTNSTAGVTVPRRMPSPSNGHLLGNFPRSPRNRAEAGMILSGGCSDQSRPKPEAPGFAPMLATNGGVVPDEANSLTEEAGRSPLVTVAIPTYRRPDFLRVAIESALAQTYRNIEILISDSDASDEITALVAGYSDPRLRYRRNDRPTNGLENALAMYRDARGELIATLHDDDLWDPSFLTVMVRPLVEDPTVVLTFADHWVMDVEGNVVVARTERFTRQYGRADLAEGRYQPFTKLAVVHGAVFFVVATVFRNGLIDWNDVPPEVAPPYEMWMRYLASRDGGAAYYVPQRLTRYRLHQVAETETRFERPAVWIFDHILLDERMADLRSEIMRTSALFRTSLGISLLTEGRAKEARRHLWQGLRAGAWRKGGVGLAISLLPPSRRADVIARIRSETSRRRSHPRAEQVRA